MDVSNLNKVILFFEEVGALTLKESKVSGRTVRTPVVEYDKVEFDLVAQGRSPLRRALAKMREEFRDDYREWQQPTKHSAQREVVDLALVVDLDVHSESEGVQGA